MGNPKTVDGIDKVIALDVVARYIVARAVQPLLNRNGRVLSVLGSTVKAPPMPRVSIVKSIATGEKTDYSLSQILASAGLLTDAWMQGLAAQSSSKDKFFIGTWPGLVKTH